MPHFVILEHDDSQGRHFDFMLETAEGLKTWAIPSAPQVNVEIPCVMLPDHRRLYLDYEGPVSGDRGTVRQWAGGVYDLERQNDAEWIVQLVGEKIAGRVRLRKKEGEPRQWFFQLEKRCQEP